MKKFLFVLFFIPLLSLMFFSVRTMVFAQTGVSGTTVTTTTSPLDFSLNNPLDDEIDSVPVLIEKLIEIVVVIAVPIITVMIIYTGFLFVQARGNPTKIEVAKKALQWTLLGAAIIIGAWTIAQIIGNTVDCLKPGVTC